MQAQIRGQVGPEPHRSVFSTKVVLRAEPVAIQQIREMFGPIPRVAVLGVRHGLQVYKKVSNVPHYTAATEGHVRTKPTLLARKPRRITVDCPTNEVREIPNITIHDAKQTIGVFDADAGAMQEANCTPAPSAASRKQSSQNGHEQRLVAMSFSLRCQQQKLHAKQD